jgi:threonylcarbamoyladenosine tRNA methylthiotransferase MtaB
MDYFMKYQTHTFGCKVNTYDTGLIQKNLLRGGFVHTLAQEKPEDQPRIHVLNTCAVTAEATKEAVKLIRRLKVQDPFCTIVVTGCAAQVDTDQFQNLLGADLVVANSHKSQLPEILNDYFKGNLQHKVFKSNIFKKEDLEQEGGVESSHTRSFLKIQDGCNSFCSFCIIPYARGKSRSIKIFDLVNKVNELHLRGHQEIVLTGVHIGDYEDGDKKLEDLVENLLLKTKVQRFRLSSLEPVEVSDRLLELYQDDRMCPHFHMSIQSANTDVLHQMKRKYGQQQVRESLLNIEKKVKNAFVGMDVIAGFPTETLEQFEDTYLTLADLPWTRLHVFPYSERKGTRAEALAVSVPYFERKNRAARLRELSAARYQERGEAQVSLIQKALVLKNSAKGNQAITREYWPVRLNLENLEELKGKEINVKLNRFVWSGGSTQDGYLEGSRI